ncbi:MAG: pabB [Gammaproteobacteria bacterium]|nr:pabB [Gammaproteobacteria bacterium]
MAVLYHARRGQWLRFTEPIKIYTANDVDSVKSILDMVILEVKKKQYAIGFVAYEAAPAFDPAYIVKSTGNFPLAWFAIYPTAQTIDFPEISSASLDALSWQLSVGENEYRAALQRIKEYIHAGDTYQVNYSFRMRTPFNQDPWQLFVHMIHAQGYGYGAFIDTEDWSICSASHELFFDYQDGRLTSKPMKGTVPRGLTQATDRKLSDWLQNSTKNRAENLMIVDMVRNDMGQIAATGSVQASSLFDIEKYPTLWQMTSTVQAATRADISGIFSALFPPASITGAPKSRTMEIIAELETEPRKIYTGSIGCIDPDQSAQFNVAIRTVLVDKKTGTAEYGVGGGIVWDSETQNELEECHTKAKVLTYVEEDFDLLETILWTPAEGYTLLPYHLDRLRTSAEYFSRRLDTDLIEQKLEAIAGKFPPQRHRIRLRITRTGEPLIAATVLRDLPQTYRIQLASHPVDIEHDLFLYHKTTIRRTYEQLLTEHPGYDDVLLFNDRNEVTESCIANVIFEFDGKLVTPPLTCGLLSGTYRRHLLEQGQIEERTIKLSDIKNNCRVFLVNSVRGMWEAVLTTTAP